MNILIMGGCGYIGFYCVVIVIEVGWYLIIFDNLSNFGEFVIEWIYEIIGVWLIFICGDVWDFVIFDEVLFFWDIEVVMYFVVYKVVGEFVEIFLSYYYNNVGGMLSVFEVMKKYGVNFFVFLFFVIVYGELK